MHVGEGGSPLGEYTSRGWEGRIAILGGWWYEKNASGSPPPPPPSYLNILCSVHTTTNKYHQQQFFLFDSVRKMSFYFWKCNGAKSLLF